MASYIQGIESLIVPKFVNYYVAYKQLLDAIELLKQKDTAADSSSGSLLKGLLLPKDFTFGDTTAIFGLIEQRPEVRFVSLLQHEVSKLNHVTALEVKTMLATLRQLDRRLERISKDGESDASMSRRVFPSAIDESEASLSREDKLNLVRSRLASISDEILVLEHYVKVNMSIFEKVIGDFDRSFSDRPALGNWFTSKLLSEPFANAPLGSLFTITARLISCCPLPEFPTTAPETSFLIPVPNVLRTKLVLSGVSALARPSIIPEQVWNSPKSMFPMRSEDIAHESLRSSSDWIRIVFAQPLPGDILSIAYDERAVEDSFVLVTYGNKREPQKMKKSDIIVGENTCGDVSVFSYEKTVFDATTLIESIKFKKCRINISVFLTENLDLAVSAASETHLERRVSAGSTASGFQTPAWVRLNQCLVTTRSDAIIARISGLGIATTVTQESFDQLTATAVDESRASTESITPYVPLGSPLEFHRPHPVLPISPRSPTPGLDRQSPAAAAGPTTKFIYPKNFMANERSCLAWISAVSVQTGIGQALLGKSGSSLVGALLCLIGLVFLWWAVYVFVKRHRQLKNPSKEGAHWFYSMKLSTAFGATQVVVLAIQSLVLLWW